MEAFSRKNGELHAEEVALSRIAREVGTPCYVYSADHITRRFREFDEVFSGLPHLVCFAMKANSNLAVLRLLGNLGSGVDVVSAGELFRAVEAGVPADRIVFAGVGKTVEEIIMAMKRGILMFNVESAGELDEINRVAESYGRKAPIALRVNPDVDPQTHPYISTGLRTSKFGIPIQEAVSAYAEAKALAHVRVIGVDCHIGAQLTKLRPFADALARVAALVRELRDAGHAALRARRHVHVLDDERAQVAAVALRVEHGHAAAHPAM